MSAKYAGPTSFYSPQELRRLGLKKVGKNVSLSRKASLYGAGTISIGDDVRIDDFCILSGRITLGRRIHIAAFAALYGSHGITVGDYAGISGRVSIYNVSDNYLGLGIGVPTVPDRYRAPDEGPVHIGRHAMIGAGSVVLPGVTIGEGAAVGALSLVKKSLAPWQVYFGVPARPILLRRRDLVLKYQAEVEKA